MPEAGFELTMLLPQPPESLGLVVCTTTSSPQSLIYDRSTSSGAKVMCFPKTTLSSGPSSAWPNSLNILGRGSLRVQPALWSAEDKTLQCTVSGRGCTMAQVTCTRTCPIFNLDGSLRYATPKSRGTCTFNTSRAIGRNLLKDENAQPPGPGV